MYGEINHWNMLKATTKMPSVTKLNVVNRLRITVKTSVERLSIMASVPAMDKRSFHMLIAYTN
jgi:hypothetical protein